MNKKTLSLLGYSLLSAFLLSFNSISFAQEAEEGEKKIKPDNDKENPLDNVDINIIKRGKKTIETHSVNGVVYKVKVTPDNAPAYYFYDTDGDGRLETRSDHDISNITVQQWKIFEW